MQAIQTGTSTPHVFQDAAAPGNLEKLLGLTTQIKEDIRQGRTPKATQACKNLCEEGRHHIARVVLEDTHADPLPVAFRLVKLLSKPDIQLKDELRGEIARAARLFIELTAFKCFQEDRRNLNVQSIQDQLTSIHTDLARDKSQQKVNQISLHFNVTCCLEALRSIETINYPSVFKDMIVIIKNQSIGKAVNLIKKLRGQLNHSWFADLLFISWMGSLHTEDENAFNILADDISRLSQQDPKIALGSVELYADMIRRGSPTIQSKALDGLIELANLRGRFGHSYWKVRYRAVQHLYSSPVMKDRAAAALLQINARESHENIRNLFTKIEKNPQIVEQWKQQESAPLWEEKAREEQELNQKTKALKALERKLAQQADQHSADLTKQRQQVTRERQSLERKKARFEAKAHNLEHLKDLLSKQVNNFLDEILVASPSQGSVPEIPEEFICPITLQPMRHPFLTPNGNSYEEHAIVNHIREGGTDPITRQKITLEDLRKNRALKDIMEKFYRNQRPQPNLNEKIPSPQQPKALIESPQAPPLPLWDALSPQGRTFLQEVSQFNIDVCIKLKWKPSQADVDVLINRSQEDDAEAQILLGICYQRGLGVIRNAKQAVQNYTKAAKHEHPMAQFVLGYCYEKGMGGGDQER